MVLDFDTREFLQNLRATKPPYECPIDDCRRIYKSFAGIEDHMYRVHQVNNDLQTTVTTNIQSNGKRGRWSLSSTNNNNRNVTRDKSPPSSTNIIKTPACEALTYAEAQLMVQVDIDGKIHRININEPMDVVFVDGKNGFNLNCDKDMGDLNGSIIDSSSVANSISSTQALNNKCKSGSKGKEFNGKGKNKGKSKTGKVGKRNNTSTVKANQSQLEEELIDQQPKLPEPSFRIIENYTAPEMQPRPSSYYRYIDKPQEELDEEIEYDMDEEDCAWLELINLKRATDNLPEVPPDTFELLMDRLEKESYFLSQNSGKDPGPAIDEDAVCCICNDGECQNSNAILFCDMCDLAVHQECYGVPYIPEGQWLCRRCLQSPSRAVDCVLCPNKGGAFKQTDDNRWTHVVCALWIPEVCFANTVFLEPIDNIDNIPAARWKLSCYICKQRNVGACIQCHKTNCYVAFHVTCAQQAGLYMKMEAIEELTAKGLQRSVRKAAYCHTHTPSDENGTALSGVYTSGDDDDSNISKKQAINELSFKEKMKKTRKILAEKRSALPVVSIPTIPPDRLTKTAAMINIPKRNQFIQRLLGYWTLKRQSRNGVPLLRRLQISYTAAGNRHHDELKDDDDEHIKRLREELKLLQRLRQDLERARLLVELIRKREKLKREYLKVLHALMPIELQPFQTFLKRVLNQLENKDAQKIFTEPVNVEEVPDYLEFIKQPMDFTTMREKINENKYTSLKQFEDDFNLIINNCMFYNEKDTMYYKAAARLRDQCKSIFKDAQQELMRVNYNEETGLHKPITSLFNDNSNVNESFAHVATEQQRLNSRLEILGEDLTKVNQLKPSSSKTKKIQSLTSQIASVKREMSLLNPTAFSLTNITSSSLTSPLSFNAVAASKAFTEVTPLPTLLNKTLTPEKETCKKTSETSRNGVLFSSDSETTDILEFSSPIRFDGGRRTMNSVSASVSFNEPINSGGNTNSKEIKNLSATTNKCFSNVKTSNLNSEVNSLSSDVLNESDNKNKTKNETTGKKRSTKSHRSSRSKKINSNESSINSSSSINPFSHPVLPQSDSFKIYRSHINSSSDTDAKSDSSASSSLNGSSDSSISVSSRSTSRSGSNYDRNNSRRKSHAEKSSKRPNSRSSRSDISVENQHVISMPLEPLDLVWAKCRGYPWYPALIVNPEMPKTGYFHNGVPIPVPPDDVLALRKNHQETVYLVLFFDAKRTWQWLPRNKLEPLGVNQNLDKAKLTESRKQTDKKAVKRAYEKAILHRCRVTGESTDLSGDSSNED